MQYNSLPGTGIKASRVSLGTMMFGGQTSEEDSFKIMDYAYEQGINFFDTANVYNNGESERIVGKWLRPRRDEIILATKAGCQMGSNPNDAGLSRRNILASVDASLKRLGTDYIDIYYMHMPDRATPVEESLEAMSGLVKSGKARYVGVSNFAAWQIADMLAICDKRNYVPPCVTQSVHNLITRGLEAELAPFLKAHNMGMVIYNPLAAGLLTGKHKRGQPAANTRFSNNEMYYNRYWSEENFAAVEMLGKIAAEYGLSLLELAMKWCVSRECADSVIVGVSRLSQLEQNLAALEGEPLSGEVMAKCDEVWRSLVSARFQYFR